MSFFDIKHIAFKLLGYPVSYTELIGTVTGLLSVYFASRASILTWPSGIVNAVFFFLLFYQVQLYPDMFLQVYFFVMTIYGWYNWKKNKKAEKVSTLASKNRLWLLLVLITGSLLAGYFFANIHLLLPQYFALPAAYPYADSSVMVCSIIATVLLANKKIENWILWIALDVVCIFLYYKKDVYFMSIEYMIFLGLSVYGLLNWRKEKYA